MNVERFRFRGFLVEGYGSRRRTITDKQMATVCAGTNPLLRYTPLPGLSAECLPEYFTFPMEIDDSGKIHVCYYDSSQGLIYAQLVSGAWQFEVVDTGINSGRFSSLALDSSGNPHISYYDQDIQALKYVYWTGNGWSKPEIVDDEGDVGKFTSLAVDSRGNVHIGYYDVTNTALKYAYWNGTGWNKDTVDNSGDVGKPLSLAVDSNGIPHISYYDATYGDLKYAVAVKR